MSLYYLAEFQSFTSCSALLLLLGASGFSLNVTGTQKYSQVKCYQLHLISRGVLPAHVFSTTAVLGLTLPYMCTFYYLQICFDFGIESRDT